MIEGYLRANNMFVDYNEVGLWFTLDMLFPFGLEFLPNEFVILHFSLNKKEHTHHT